MDISASVRSYPLQDDMDMQGHIYHILEKSSYFIIVRTHIVVLDIHCEFLCCKFLMYPVLNKRTC